MATIDLKRLKAADVIPDRVRETYIGSFPEDERREWADIIARIKAQDPFFSFYLIEADNECAGFVTTWQLPGAMYIEHFAVFPEKRSSGIGADVLAEIISVAGQQPVVLEVELPQTSPEAVRRIAFYQRNGFSAMDDFPYFQPPYRPGGESVPLMLMTTRPLHDAKGFVIMLHTLVYNQ